MASLLERMNMNPDSSTGPIRRTKSGQSSSRSSTPYNRSRPPKGDVEAPWSHDLYESHNSLSARLSSQPGVPKPSINNLAQRALRDATGASGSKESKLSIKGASAVQGNVVEVGGLVAGTTADDVVAIFKRCGTITSAKLVSGGGDVKIRVSFKAPSSATGAVQKFHNQPADGKILSVRIVGSTSTGSTLGNRLGGPDGLGLVRDEGSVDVLMGADSEVGSKMRSDSIMQDDPRAHILVAPPGTDPTEYTQGPSGRGGRRGRGRGGRGRGGRRGGGRQGGGTGNMEVE